MGEYMLLHNMHLSSQAEQSEHAQMKAWSFYKTMLKVTSHHLCHVLFIRSESVGPVYTYRERVLQGHGYQEVWTPRVHLRGSHCFCCLIVGLKLGSVFQYGGWILKILSFKRKSGESDENVVLPSSFPFWELKREIFRLLYLWTWMSGFILLCILDRKAGVSSRERWLGSKPKAVHEILANDLVRWQGFWLWFSTPIFSNNMQN